MKSEIQKEKAERRGKEQEKAIIVREKEEGEKEEGHFFSLQRLNASRKYLEESFQTLLKAKVNSPTVLLSFVEVLKIFLSSQKEGRLSSLLMNEASIKEGMVDGKIPIYGLVFYCVRGGAIDDAIKVLRNWLQANRNDLEGFRVLSVLERLNGNSHEDHLLR